jgi:hypothetical protein
MASLMKAPVFPGSVNYCDGINQLFSSSYAEASNRPLNRGSVLLAHSA